MSARLVCLGDGVATNVFPAWESFVPALGNRIFSTLAPSEATARMFNVDFVDNPKFSQFCLSLSAGATLA